MVDDPELKAMSGVLSALEGLEDAETRLRVLNWVASRLGLATAGQLAKGSGAGGAGASSLDQSETVELESFETVADIFASANCKTEPEKALVVAAYLQERKEKAELTGREINKELHNLGHGIKNITMAISSLIDRKPNWMIQTRKEGKAKQAQKKYKVTVKGLAAVHNMLSKLDEE